MAKAKEAEVQEEAVSMVDQKAYLNEKVSMMIPRDEVNPKRTTATIQVNGKTWQFKRGYTVEVPRYVYLAFRDAQVQQNIAIDLMASLAQDD